MKFSHILSLVLIVQSCLLGAMHKKARAKTPKKSVQTVSKPVSTSPSSANAKIDAEKTSVSKPDVKLIAAQLNVANFDAAGFARNFPSPNQAWSHPCCLVGYQEPQIVPYQPTKPAQKENATKIFKYIRKA